MTSSLLIQQTFGGGAGEGRGSHKIFTNRRGDQQFFCFFQGGINSLMESLIPFLPHPRELNNDNSLEETKHKRGKRFSYIFTNQYFVVIPLFMRVMRLLREMMYKILEKRSFQLIVTV